MRGHSQTGHDQKSMMASSVAISSIWPINHAALQISNGINACAVAKSGTVGACMATLGSVPASSRKPASLARVAHLAEQNVQPANDLAPNMTVSPHCLHLTIRFTPPSCLV